MRSFFKFFFASLLAMIVFVLLAFFILAGVVSNIASSKTITIDPNSVLVIDLSKPILEQEFISPLNKITRQGPGEIQGLHQITNLIHDAAGDSNIKGIYLEGGDDPNGFATCEELRNALLAFKKSGKFIYAYADAFSQKAYYVATAADSVFLNPQGDLDFRGLSVQIMFIKGTLDKLEIDPQIFYDGKFKSATEPLRVTQMTEPNRIQTTAFLDDMYNHFLYEIGIARNIDTAALYKYANDFMIQTAADAYKYKLVDGLKYDDQMMNTIKKPLQLGSDEKINFVSLDDYQNVAKNTTVSDSQGSVAIIYAQGDIVDGSDNDNNVEIAADDYVKLIRKARENDNIKAIVFRVNSPGGSALAAEKIWRELSLAKQEKPVIVSMGDYAASGGYYISCNADSIFTQPNTLTGSIGVFSIIPNLQKFFKDKLGITFDGVKTAQYADMGSIDQPLTDAEKQILQSNTDSVYATFKKRVEDGRHLSDAYVDSIAQGRVWSGLAAIQIGLADRIGGINDAVHCAARMAHLTNYSVKEYPEFHQTQIEKLISEFNDQERMQAMKTELGSDYKIYEQVKSIQQLSGTIQARLPFSIDVE